MYYWLFVITGIHSKTSTMNLTIIIAQFNTAHCTLYSTIPPFPGSPHHYRCSFQYSTEHTIFHYYRCPVGRTQPHHYHYSYQYRCPTIIPLLPMPHHSPTITDAPWVGLNLTIIIVPINTYYHHYPTITDAPPLPRHYRYPTITHHYRCPTNPPPLPMPRGYGSRSISRSRITANIDLGKVTWRVLDTIVWQVSIHPIVALL